MKTVPSCSLIKMQYWKHTDKNYSKGIYIKNIIHRMEKTGEEEKREKRSKGIKTKWKEGRKTGGREAEREREREREREERASHKW